MYSSPIKIPISNTERKQQILQLLDRLQRVTVADLCSNFTISEATARRDLDFLAERGKIQRVRGGAILARLAPPELPILQRSGEQAAEKERIGRLAASLVADGETVFLSSGTTALQVALNLRNRSRLTVITNSLPVINALSGQAEISLISLGGLLRHSELSFIGHITEQSLAEVRADKVFLGVRALSLNQGLMNDYLAETMTDRAILRIGRQVIVVADHTKCGCTSAAFVAPIQCFHTLVTDAGADPAFIQSIQALGVQVLLA